VLRGGFGAGAALVALVVGEPQPAKADPTFSSQELARWRAQLPAEQFHILFESGTEPSGSSPLLKEARSGQFNCAACGNALFAASTKFDSGTGWPSFYQKLASVEHTSENQALWALAGTEVHCASCRGHLGHLFYDGWLWNTPTNRRYCIDGLAVSFAPDGGAAVKLRAYV